MAEEIPLIIVINAILCRGQSHHIEQIIAIRRGIVLTQELENSFDAICESVAHDLGFKVEHDINLGAGNIDQVWSRQDHPNMPEMKFAVQIIAEVATSRRR